MISVTVSLMQRSGRGGRRLLRVSCGGASACLQDQLEIQCRLPLILYTQVRDARTDRIFFFSAKKIFFIFHVQKAILFYKIRIKFGRKFPLTLLNLEGMRLKVIYDERLFLMRKYSVRYEEGIPHKKDFRFLSNIPDFFNSVVFPHSQLTMNGALTNYSA